jgi:transposase
LAQRIGELSPLLLRLLEDLVDDWRQLDKRIEAVTTQIETLAKQDESCKRLMAMPGIGPLIASAMIAAIGDGAALIKGRDFAAWLGLVPKQISTGDRTILGSISRRGNQYLRTLFVQGARSVLFRSNSWANYTFARWLTGAARRLHKNVLAIALANKLARIALAVLHRGTRSSQRSPRKPDLKGFLPRFARRNDDNGNKVDGCPAAPPAAERGRPPLVLTSTS